MRRVLCEILHSTNQKCSQLLFVTKFPNQLCVISCATTNAKERSPAFKQRFVHYSVTNLNTTQLTSAVTHTQSMKTIVSVLLKSQYYVN